MRRIRKYWKVSRSVEKDVEMGGDLGFLGRERLVINYVSNLKSATLFYFH